MQTSGLFEKIETEHPGLCIPNVNFMNEPKDWIPNTISVSAFENYNCQESNKFTSDGSN